MLHGKGVAGYSRQNKWARAWHKNCKEGTKASHLQMSTSRDVQVDPREGGNDEMKVGKYLIGSALTVPAAQSRLQMCYSCKIATDRPNMSVVETKLCSLSDL